MLNQQPRIAVVTRETRLKGLVRRWATRGQAKFVFRKARAVAAAQITSAPEAIEEFEEAADRDFQDLETEDRTYESSVHELVRSLNFGLPVQVIDREFLPNFDFALCAAVVVVGQDGLVANTAKYALGIPIIGINPDPSRFDGVLLPFVMPEARQIVGRVLNRQAHLRSVTLARAVLHDGQKLLAFNDLFLGVRGHTSARYQLQMGENREQQSSSGLLVSTGAGSTGWISSVFNMARGVTEFLGTKPPEARQPLRWEDRELLWAVREPFVSRTSQANLVMGRIGEGQELVVESMIPNQGVIFSDGVETDFLEFNGGTVARLGVAPEFAQLVVK